MPRSRSKLLPVLKTVAGQCYCKILLYFWISSFDWLMTIKLNPVFLILVLLHNRFKSLQAPSRVFCGLVVLAAVSATQASRSPAARAAAGRRRFRRPAAAATEKASPFRSATAAAKERREACRRHRWATGVKRSWRQIQVGKDDDICIYIYFECE